MRIFGAQNEPGVQIIEKDSQKTIEPSSLGNACFIGVSEKGSLDELIFTNDFNDFVDKCGFELNEYNYYLPGAVKDFYNNNNGYGQAIIMRVADGHELEGSLDVYGKHCGSYFYSSDDSWIEIPELLFRVTAKNGGRWSGQFDAYEDALASSAKIHDTYIETDLTMLKNKWQGGFLYIVGSGQIYNITSNTTAGVINLESFNNVLNDYNISGSADLHYQLILLDQLIDDRYSKNLSICFKPGTIDKSLYFGMDVFSNEELKYSYDNLTLDSADVNYFIENVINDDESNDDFEVEAISDKYSSLHQGSNRSYEVISVGSNYITVQPFKVMSFSGTGTGKIGSVVWSAEEIPVLPIDLSIEFTADSVFTVEDTSGKYNDLPGGTTGVAWASGFDELPSFTISAGTKTGDIFEVKIDPLPWWIKNDEYGTFYSSAKNIYVYSSRNLTTKYLAKKVSFKKIYFYNTLGTEVVAPQKASYLGDALTFPVVITLSTNDAFDIDGSSANVAGAVAAASYTSLTLLVAALNSAWTIGGGAGSPFSEDTSDGDRVKFTDPDTVDSGLGKDSFYSLNTASDSCYSSIGFTETDANVYGDVGSLVQVSFPEPLWGGVDGFHDSTTLETKFLEKLGLDDNLLESLKGLGLGLVKLYCPGIVDEDILKALTALGENFSYTVRIDPDDSLSDENDVIDWVENDVGKNDFLVCGFPGWKKDGSSIFPLGGEILGMEARIAGAYDGYHKASAGVNAKLLTVKKLYPEIIKLNESLLNSHNIQIIKKYFGNYITWGDRQISLDNTWKWKHQREYVSNIERVLLEQMDWTIFEIPNSESLQLVLSSLTSYFSTEKSKGAIKNYQITINSKNEVYLTLDPIETLEQLKIVLQKGGIVES